MLRRERCLINRPSSLLSKQKFVQKRKKKEKKEEKIKEVLLKSVTILLHDTGTDRIFYDRQEGDCRRGVFLSVVNQAPSAGFHLGEREREEVSRIFTSPRDDK